MENQNIEETNANPVQEVTADDIQENITGIPQNEEKDTPNEKTDSPEQYSEREKRYYARMKQAENIAKQAREELAKYKKPASNIDIDAILEIQEATHGLDSQEIAELKLRANAQKLSLPDARKNENFVLWQTAYRAKVDKEKTALPSTTMGNVQKEKSLKEMTYGERRKIFEKMGLVTSKARPPRPPLE